MTISEYDLDVMVKTVVGEAGGEGVTGQQAVAWVIINRATIGPAHPHFGDGSIAEACLAPWQFSCWNADSPELKKLNAMTSADIVYNIVQNVCQLCLSGKLPDVTNGCTYYYRAGSLVPAWAVNEIPACSIGHHLFFRGIK